MGAPGTTEGPWCVGHTQEATDRDLSKWYDTAVHAGSLSNRGNTIAVVHMGGSGATDRSRAAVEANAHQIAASGALYDALEGLLACIRVVGDSVSIRLVEIGERTEPARAALALARGEQPNHPTEGAI